MWLAAAARVLLVRDRRQPVAEEDELAYPDVRRPRARPRSNRAASARSRRSRLGRDGNEKAPPKRGFPRVGEQMGINPRPHNVANVVLSQLSYCSSSVPAAGDIWDFKRMAGATRRHRPASAWLSTSAHALTRAPLGRLALDAEGRDRTGLGRSTAIGSSHSHSPKVPSAMRQRLSILRSASARGRGCAASDSGRLETAAVGRSDSPRRSRRPCRVWCALPRPRARPDGR